MIAAVTAIITTNATANHAHIGPVIATTSNRCGRMSSANGAPSTIVTQTNTRIFVNGTQLLITATIDAAISSANMTVRFCASPNGAMRLNAMIMPVTAIANGAALPSAVGRNRPRMRRVSDSNIVRNDGHASMQASTSVIWIGMNGNGTFKARQKNDTSTE